MNNNVKRITYSAVLIVLAIVVPQLFHFTGVPQSGAVFLPMHIPVLIAGFVLGPVYGLALGGIAPIASFFISSMPSAERLPFMILELMTYGFLTGFIYYTLNMKKYKIGKYISLIGAMIGGRIVYALSLLVAGNLLGITETGVVAALTAVVTGIYGIILQLVIIPPIILALEKGRLIAFDNRKQA